ncbi:unnamed protein product [Peronospora belbahrii]|uniref:Uncharacterized protein n=1 Tax=Peronospora belbahrii TaxID=622444 RepID=A0AAU9L4H7_9STRA|nr:unnamed protein product [Peronospora belbahrii]
MLDFRETFSGVMGAFCCVYRSSFEVVKVRLQTQGTMNAYKGVSDAFYRIATEEGVVALWKGAVPALFSSVIENSVLFSANGFVSALSWQFRLSNVSSMKESISSRHWMKRPITIPENTKCSDLLAFSWYLLSNELKGLAKYYAEECAVGIADRCSITFRDGLRRSYAQNQATLAGSPGPLEG